MKMANMFLYFIKKEFVRFLKSLYIACYFNKTFQISHQNDYLKVEIEKEVRNSWSFLLLHIYCLTGIRHKRMFPCQCISYQWIWEQPHNSLLSKRQTKLHSKQNSREVFVQGNRNVCWFARNLQDPLLMS